MKTPKKIPDISLMLLKAHQFFWHFLDFLAKFLKFLEIPDISDKVATLL